MILSYFFDKNLQHQLIIEKPIAIILDNYSVHHAIAFTELCNFLNMDLIHLPPYSPKYNPIEQVWRTIKAKISRKFITSIEQLKYIFENEFKQVIDNKSYWKNWLWKFLYFTFNSWRHNSYIASGSSSIISIKVFLSSA